MFAAFLFCCHLALAAPPGQEVLEGELFHTVVDPAGSRLTVKDARSVAVVTLSTGLALRPGRPARRFSCPPDGAVDFLRGDASPGGANDGSDGSEQGALVGAVIPLAAEGRNEQVTVAVRSGPFGPILMYAVPRRALMDLAGPWVAGPGRGAAIRFGRTLRGHVPGVAGRSLPGSVFLRAPIRTVLKTRGVFGRQRIEALRLRGAYGIDDESPAGSAAHLEVRGDGMLLYEGPPARRGVAPIPFDFALGAVKQLAITVRGDGEPGSRAGVDLVDATFTGAGGSRFPLGDLFRAGEPGVDLLLGAKSDTLIAQGFRPLATEPGLRSGGPAVIDAGDMAFQALRPPPLLLMFQDARGWMVGIGLGFLPNATRFALERGRVALNLPLFELGDRLSPAEPLRITLTVILGHSREELLRRYRATLVEMGAVAPLDAVRGLRGVRALRAPGEAAIPDWWRRPLLLVRPPPHLGPHSRYDAVAVAKQVATAEKRLGCGAFTVVIDGQWNGLFGDPAPADDFGSLRGLIAAQHIRDRQVILRWNLFRAEGNSFADITGVRDGSRVRAVRDRAYGAYVRGVVRHCLGPTLQGLGADGFLLTGLPGVAGDWPSLASGSGPIELGFREISVALEIHHREVGALRPDALLLAPVGAPQLVGNLTGVYLDGGGGDPGTLDSQVRLLAAVAPDVPIFRTSAHGSVADLLLGVMHSVAEGVPVVSSHDLAGLDDAQARTLGALLRLCDHRQLGWPEALPDGRWRMASPLRRWAETLAEDRGVAVFPDASRAEVALVRRGDAPLCFLPAKLQDGDGAKIELRSGIAVLKGGRPGRVYHFRMD